MTAKKAGRHVIRAKGKRGAKPSSSSPNTTGGSTGPLSGVISVRMYRVGFGVCFLVSLPTNGTDRAYMLVDCGVHARGDIGSIQQVVSDIVAVTNRKLAIVIAT